MEQEGRGVSKRSRPRFPCRSCFLNCEYKVTTNSRHGFPCSPSLRLWAWGHRDDSGDEHGYVHERKEGKDG